MSIKRVTNKTRAISTLRHLFISLVLEGLPVINDEVEYLSENLTVKEIHTVFRLLNATLQITHNVGHLSYYEAMRAIQKGIKPPMLSNQKGLPS